MRPRSGTGRTFSFLKTGTRVLSLICGGLVIMVAGKWSSLNQAGPLALTPAGWDRRPAAASPGQFPKQGEFKGYREVFKKRDIFASPLKLSSPGLDQPAQTPSPAPSWNSDGKFKLVGIILDTDPRAVVEHPEEGNTLFLSPGDRLDEAVLEAVQAGKAVFCYRGRKFELKF